MRHVVTMKECLDCFFADCVSLTKKEVDCTKFDMTLNYRENCKDWKRMNHDSQLRLRSKGGDTS